VFRKARSSWHVDEIVAGASGSGPFGLAAAYVELGNLCALGPYTDAELALQCYQHALQVGGNAEHGMAVRDAFANNTACVFAAAGALPQAERALKLCSPSPLRQRNAARFAAGQPLLHDLQFVELLPHVVVKSRASKGVVVDAHGRVRDTAVRPQVPWDVFSGPNGVPWSAAFPTGAAR
jgi:hypothetical protein